MLFTRKELEFLDVFQSCVSTKSPFSDKFEIRGIKETGEVIFSQNSGDVILYKKMTKEVEEDFKWMFPTIKINSILKTMPKDVEFTIESSKLIFKKSNYEFETLEFGNEDILGFINVNEKNACDKFLVKDLSVLPFLKPYMGDENQSLDTIAFFDKHFISSNKEFVVAGVKTSNVIDPFYFSKVFAQLITQCKISEIEVRDFKEQEFYSFTLEDYSMEVICVAKEYKLPNILSEEYTPMHEHTTKVTIKKSELLESFSRIKIVSSDSTYQRVFITLEGNKFIIESKDTSYAKEEVDAVYDTELENWKFVVSINYITNIINSIPSDDVIVRVAPDSDAVAIKFEDVQKTMFFIHLLSDGE